MNNGDERKAADLRSYIGSVEGELARPLPLEDARQRADGCDAIYIPGGHGPMEDLPGCAPLGELTTAAYWDNLSFQEQLT